MRIVVIYIVVIVVVYIVVITVVYMLLYSESHAAGPMRRMGFTVREYARSLLSHCDLMVNSG
jgi:flagellar basal body-associated protein FliL